MKAYADTGFICSLYAPDVASAVVLGSGCFLSFDKRQLRLAKAAGLATPKL